MQANRNGVHGEDAASFEESFARLQEMVQKLSQGNLTLQEALASFEEGMQLADLCTQMLDAAELRLRHVSASATQAAAQSVGELEEFMVGASRARAGDDKGLATDGIVAMEIESTETRLFFDTSATPPGALGGNLAYSPLPGERRGGGGAGAGAGGSGNLSNMSNPLKNAPRPVPTPDELDPLFDEDD